MNQLSFADARHLTVRTGLGEEWKIIKQREGRSRADVINQIIKIRSDWAKPAPSLLGWNTWNRLAKQNPASREQARVRLARDKQALQEWWLDTMIETHNPVVERMVMFWHNHFTSSLDKINQPSLILKQNRLFRHLALGNFRTLLQHVARDPAMMIYLDCNENGAGEPNENFARELMELYTIGEGNFTEDDVRAAAKAFTGWSVNREKQEFSFKRSKHDYSPITFLGHTGNLSGNEVLDILLNRPETAIHIAKKFWKEFIDDDEPDMKTINAWAGHFRKSDYEISALFKAVLSSQAFWTTNVRGTKVKSPIELIVGTLRTLPIRVPIPRDGTTRTRGKRLTDLCHSLGQKLFVPPDPSGWPGGSDWIDSNTLNTRKNMLANFTNIESRNTLDKIPRIPVKELSNWLLAAKPSKALPQETVSNREKVYSILLDPAYQLT